MPDVMQAARCEVYGPPDTLVVTTVPVPQPGPGEVLVEIRFAAVNFPDVLFVANQYQVSVPLPFTAGSEFAGIVTELGEGVTNVAPGTTVAGGAMVGAYAQYVVVPAEGLWVLPDGFPLPAAAAAMVSYLTAYHAVRSIGDIRPGDQVVVLGAAGALGLAAMDIAKVLGGTVIAAAGGPTKVALCLERGAEAAIDYESEDLKNRIKELTGGRGADLVIDPVGGRWSEQALRSTAWGGRYVVVGFASGEIPRIPLNLVLLKGPIVRGFELRTFADHAPEASARDRAEVLQLLLSGQLSPHISAVHPLSDVSEAMASVAERRSTGKVLIDPWAS